jgi:hypothetical protein
LKHKENSFNACGNFRLKAAQALLEQIKTQPGGEGHIQMAQGIGIAQTAQGSIATVTISGKSPAARMAENVLSQTAQGPGIAQALGSGATATVTIGLIPPRLYILT